MPTAALAAILISANWDTVVDEEVQRILAAPSNKFGMEINGFHIHGSIYDLYEFYLPSEHTKELYRTRIEKKKFDKKNATFMHNVMKVKHSIIFLVLGFCLDLIGGLFKIMHYQYGDTLLIIATIMKVFGALTFLYKLMTYPKFKDFINW